MDRRDLPRLTKVLEHLCEAFYRRYSVALADVYLLGLADVSIDLVEENALLAIRNNQGMPPVSELRRPEGYQSPQARALAAWNAIRAELHVRGPTQADELAQRVLNSLGGWPRLLRAEGDAMTWLRKEFVELLSQAIRELEIERDRAAIHGAIRGAPLGQFSIGAAASSTRSKCDDSPPTSSCVSDSRPSDARESGASR